MQAGLLFLKFYWLIAKVPKNPFLPGVLEFFWIKNKFNFLRAKEKH